MRQLLIAIALLFFAACTDSTEQFTVETQGFGSFYVTNPWDSASNNIQAVVDTQYTMFRVDTINPTDSVDAIRGTWFWDTLGTDSLFLKADTGTTGWIFVK